MKSSVMRLALALGLLSALAGAPAAMAGPCGTDPIDLSTMFSGSFSCTQQDKIWSDFTTTLTGSELATLKSGTALFTLVNIGGMEEHTLAIRAPWEQDTTYALSYTITIDPAALAATPDLSFVQATGGVLFASSGGAATLTKTFTDQNDTPFPGLVADATNPSVDVPTPIPTTAINVTDTFFTDSSNVTGFANTFSETRIPEPSGVLLIGSAMAGLGWLRRRSRRATTH